MQKKVEAEIMDTSQFEEETKNNNLNLEQTYTFLLSFFYS